MDQQSRILISLYLLLPNFANTCHPDYFFLCPPRLKMTEVQSGTRVVVTQGDDDCPEPPPPAIPLPSAPPIPPPFLPHCPTPRLLRPPLCRTSPVPSSYIAKTHPGGKVIVVLSRRRQESYSEDPQACCETSTRCTSTCCCVLS